VQKSGNKYRLFLLFFTGLFFIGLFSYGFTTTIQVDSVSCNGGNDGKIVVTVNGGAPPFIYTWSTGQKDTTNNPADSLMNLTAGNYWVVIENAGSTDFYNIAVYEPDAIHIDFETTTDVSCNGGNDGTITITASGGTPFYSFSIDGGSTFYRNNGSFSGLSAGIYSVVVRDNHGCIQTGSLLTVNEPPAIAVQTDSVRAVSCNGNTDGAIAVTVNGGTAPYNYLWSGPNGYFSTNEDISGVVSGNYILTVTDANNCIFTNGAISVYEPAILTVSLDYQQNVTCNGADNGLINVTVTGGTQPYTFLWNGPGGYSSTSKDITSLASGNYSLTVIDAHGCIAGLGPVTISEPPALGITTDSVTNVTCYGGSNGAISVMASGGTPPYVFSIDGGVTFLSNGGSFTGLCAGNYPTAVQDANGCVTNGVTLTLSEPQAFVINVVSHSDVACHGGSDGSITMHASGGTSPYVYSVDGGTTFVDNNGSFTGLNAGAWPLAVRDVNGCIMLGDTVVISDPPALTIDTVNKTDISCHGLSDGKIDISASGGTAPWQYSIDGGVTFSDGHLFENLSAGDYDIAIRDANGCLLSGSTVTVTEPPQLVINKINVTEALCAGGSSGEIHILASGGTGSYEYSINNGQTFYDNNGIFQQLPANTYSPVVRDINGCTAVAVQVIVDEPPAIQMIVDTVKPTCSKNSFDGKISVQATGGTGNFVYSIDDGISFAAGGTFTGLEGGTYHIIAKDGNGCIESTAVHLQGRYTVIADAGRDTAICPGTSVQLHGSGGQSYQWEPAGLLDDPAVIDPLASPLTNTNFILTVTSGICYDKDTVIVMVYPIHGLDAGRDTVIPEGCSITLTATGEGFTEYFWYPSEGLDATTGRSVVASPVRDMTYFAEAITTEGCLEKDSINIVLIREIFIPSGFTPNGDGKNDTWHFGYTEYYPDMTVEVFDRWGHRVFYSRGYDSSKEWDGTFQGKALASGTYYYVIILHDAKHTPPVTGPVTIIR